MSKATELLHVTIIDAIGRISKQFRGDQRMTYVVFCINQDHPDRHTLVSEIDIADIHTYLDELEDDIKRQHLESEER